MPDEPTNTDKDTIRNMVMALSRGDHDEATTAAAEVISNKTARLTQELEEGLGNPMKARRNRLGGGGAGRNARRGAERGMRGRNRIGEDGDPTVEGAGDMEEVMAAIIQGNRGYDAAFDEAKRVLGADFDSGWFMELYNDMAEQSDDDREYHMNQDDPDWDEGQRQQDKIDQFRNEY
jgi:hypothetical protein